MSFPSRFGRSGTRCRRVSSKPPIALVLKHYYGIQLRDRSGWQKILCPLHPETNPSASANTGFQRWACFVCDVSEDSYDVIQREEGFGFRQAQEFADSRFGTGSEDVPLAVQGESGRGVHEGSGAGRRRRPVSNRIRRFGSYWP
ncbi:CHC2 zinc finger domain-containing protein [Streptantibioticus cattleyicolor]|uniref:CHC2 zinc finger domain-containing protein n=1 Tax=Streptantibioticus cattleyicolor TaxID=29303 RepID=UPI000997B59D